MKYLIIMLAFTLSLFAADATKAAKSLGVYNNYGEALKKAKSTDKLLVFVIVWDPCNACDKLVKKTLTDKKVQKTLKDSTTLILDYKADMPQKLKVHMAPHIYYINPRNEEILFESIGRISPTAFLRDYKEAKEFF